MSWHAYNNDTEDYVDPTDLDVGHETKEDPIITFEEQSNGQLRISFDLELCSVHQSPTGDVYVTVKT